MNPAKRPSVGAVVKIGVTIAIIAFLFARVDLSAMVQNVAHANFFFLLLALALYELAISLNVFKWQLLVRAQNLAANFGDLMTYSLVGLFFGNLLPGNVGGDVVRAYGLMRASGRAEAAAITVLVDRLTGFVAYMIAAAVMVFLAAFTLARGEELEQLEVATVVVAGVFLLGCALLFSRRFSQRIKWLFEFPPLKRVQPIAQRVYEALQIYRHSYRALAFALVLSVGNVVVTTLAWYAVGTALGLTVPLFYYFLFNPIMAFILVIPISFNGLGPKEALWVFFFGLIGVPEEAALSMSLVFHLIIILTSLPGGILWWKDRARIAPDSMNMPVAAGPIEAP